MDIPTAFPLFRLPRLVILMVFGMLNPFEMVDLSMASSKTKSFVKSFLHRTQNPVYYFGANTLMTVAEVAIRTADISFVYMIMPVGSRNQERVDYRNFPDESAEKMRILTVDVLQEWKQLFTTALELFPFVYNEIHVQMDSTPEHNKSVTDFIKSQKDSTDHCLMYGETKPDENVKYFLNNVNVTDVLRLNVKLSDRFQLSTSDGLQKLDIHHASWLNYEKFIRLNAVQLCINGAPLTNRELTNFLKSWMNSESHQHLRNLTTGVDDFVNFAGIFVEVPHKRVCVRRVLDVVTEYNAIVGAVGGFEIKRNDGATGTIYLGENNNFIAFKMIVTNVPE